MATDIILPNTFGAAQLTSSSWYERMSLFEVDTVFLSDSLCAPMGPSEMEDFRAVLSFLLTTLRVSLPVRPQKNWRGCLMQKSPSNTCIRECPTSTGILQGQRTSLFFLIVIFIEIIDSPAFVMNNRFLAHFTQVSAVVTFQCYSVVSHGH